VFHSPFIRRREGGKKREGEGWEERERERREERTEWGGRVRICHMGRLYLSW
jgi:hypothetical protein